MKRILITIISAVSLSAAAESPFEGTWAFELPDGKPAWLGVQGEEVKLLWSVGSARAAKDVQFEAGKLSFTRNVKWKPYGVAENTRTVKAPFVFTKKGDGFKLEVQHHPADDPEKLETLVLDAKKMPPMPPKPDLAKVKFGEPIELFDGKSLAGWKLFNPKKKNGWRAENGELVNETTKTDFSAYGDYANLVTERKFDDFRLTIEYNVGSNCNSGIYLRGAYEAQVVDRDSRMQGISGPGAIFGRIAPSVNAGKAGGEWNKYVLTLVDRHITVELNGKVVTDNAPLEGCTGGGTNADDTAAGPIFLQGDHTSVRYRNINLEPVVK